MVAVTHSVDDCSDRIWWYSVSFPLMKKRQSQSQDQQLLSVFFVLTVFFLATAIQIQTVVG